jgi:hypothetical protein
MPCIPSGLQPVIVDLAIDHAIRRRHLTAGARVQLQGSPCGVVVKIALRQAFLQVLWSSLANYHSIKAPLFHLSSGVGTIGPLVTSPHDKNNKNVVVYLMNTTEQRSLFGFTV